jgi:hypothetical protein
MNDPDNLLIPLDADLQHAYFQRHTSKSEGLELELQVEMRKGGFRRLQ